MARTVRVTPDLARFELERREMERSFLLFVVGAWHIVEPERVYKHNWHIEVLCEFLEAMGRLEIRNGVINIPPRNMKSLLCGVLFPAWIWTWRPEARFIYASYSQSLSDDDASKCRRLIMSKWYQVRWGHKVQLRAGRKTVRRFETTAGGVRQATSVRGAVTGKGGDFVIADDPHNVRERESDAKRVAVCDWWDQSMSTRGDDPATFCRLIVMQRVHEKDLSGHVLAESDEYVHLKIPTRYEGERALSVHYEGPRRTPVQSLPQFDPRSEVGELLWPTRFDAVSVASIAKHLGPYGDAAQLQQRPAPREGGIFKGFKVYGRAVLDRLMAERLQATWIQTWDMTFKGAGPGARSKKGRSFVVGQVWCRLGAHAFLVDQFRAQVGFSETCDAVKAMAEMWPQATPILIEDKANGPAVIDALYGVVPALTPVPPRGDKEARAEAVSKFVSTGNVWIPDEEIAEWAPEFFREARLFPMSSTNDQVDCMSMALDYLYLQDAGPPLGLYGSMMKSAADTGLQVPAELRQQSETERVREEARIRRQLDVDRREHPERYAEPGERTYTGANYRGPGEGGG